MSASAHFSYEFIQQFAYECKQRLTGSVLKEAYTLSKDELVLLFEQNGQSIRFRMITRFQTAYLFWDEDWSEIKGSNAQPCFEHSFGLTIQAIHLHEGNRSFEMQLNDDHYLLFKCYGALTNVVEIIDNEVSDVFRFQIANDWNMPQQVYPKVDVATLKTIYTYSIYKNEHDEVILSLVPLPFTPLAQTHSAIEAAHLFAKYALSHQTFKEKKQHYLHLFSGELKRINTQIKQIQHALAGLLSAIPDEEIGHIIMANLHELTSVPPSVELFDFYRNKTITIKLKTDLSAAENAAYYYRRAKNKQLEINQHENKLQAYEEKRIQLEHQLKLVQEATQLKALKNFDKQTQKEQPFPFRRFMIEGFEVWVGKNANNNDLLTQKHAHKNDWWLHAKDVTGSHVIIKHKSGKKLPESVLLSAAGIAAYYSKHKGNSLAPVSYTLKKFVRKPKGFAPGQVVLDREEVMMVEPTLPENNQ